MIGPVTSDMATLAAVSGARPFSSWRSTFSTTTIASSTTSPMAKTMPSMLTVFSEKPIAYMTASVPISETGMAMPVISVVRHDCRKRNTTAKTRSSASLSVIITSCIDADTNMFVS